jgi:hypothetical protein
MVIACGSDNNHSLDEVEQRLVRSKGPALPFGRYGLSLFKHGIGNTDKLYARKL